MHRFPSLTRLERVVLGLGVISIVLAHASLIAYRTYANVDEAYASALASRMLDGFGLYDGAVSQRGPLMYYAYAAFAWLHGWDNILALRFWALAFALLHVALVYVVARQLISRSAAILASGISCYALAFGLPVDDGVALNAEVLQVPMILAAVLLQARAMLHRAGSRHRRIQLGLGGVLLGASMAIKPTAAVHLVPIALWLVAEVRRHGRWSVLAGDLAAGVGGAIVVPFAFVVHAALNGTMREMYFYTVVYNRDVHMRPPSVALSWVKLLFYGLVTRSGFVGAMFVLCAHAIPRLARRARRARTERSISALGRGFGPRHYVAAHFVLAAAMGASMYRFFPHYFVPALPFLSLCLGALFDRALVRGPAVRTAFVGFMVFCLGAAGLVCRFGEHADGRVAHDETVNLMARTITATTNAEDRIFVWGFSSWLYGYSHRRPAGRYVFSTYVTGYVPWFPESLSVEQGRIVPGSVEALLSDLEHEKPAIIVDAGAVMMLRPMRTYAAFSDYLHANYCFDFRLGALDLFRRRKDRQSCAQSSFPRPAAGIDYMGNPLRDFTPRQVDARTNRQLPEGNFFKPIYFLDGPVPQGVEAAQTQRRQKDEGDARARGLCVPELNKFDCDD
jgi:hypothetical protein